MPGRMFALELLQVVQVAHKITRARVVHRRCTRARGAPCVVYVPNGTVRSPFQVRNLGSLRRGRRHTFRRRTGPSPGVVSRPGGG